VDVAGSEKQLAVIPARSKRQVMDWSLVLASQDIPATIVHSPETGWSLQVEPDDLEGARESIRQFRLENRHWTWRQPIPGTETAFHWGGLGWCLLLIMVHWVTSTSYPQFRDAAVFATAKVHQGQWWRAFTAILLHENLAHLLANSTSGFLLLGLAMARYSPALALLASYLAGAAGNLAGLLIYPHDYTGLGASGMVMGALGLISIPPLHTWSTHPRALKQLSQAVFASIMLFVLLGVDPASDVIAHLGGFAAGILFALGLNLPPARVLQNKAVIWVAWVTLLALLLLTTALAIWQIN
jgi:membrane associated rhomboid family serine protease